MSAWLGDAIRRVPSPREVYLTFDDGPEPGQTERVLDALARNGAKATFFVVAQKAARHAELTRRILAEGHAIGNHSLDHRYGAFFGGARRMLDWVDRSESLLRQTLGDSPGAQGVGFRPPAGVRTPELASALRERGIPLVLWNERFFDSTWGWSPARARRSSARLQPGSIVLLHDAQKPAHAARFVETLEIYLRSLHARGFQCAALTREQCSRAVPGARAFQETTRS